MPTPILMPALSPTMEVGTLAKWLVKEGDSVQSGDVIAEIETDKATMEVEAVDEGTMGKIVIGEGTADVPVNETIALLLAEGEDPSALEGAAVPPQASAPAPVAAPETGGGGSMAGAETAAAAPTAATATAPAKLNGSGGRILASPLAKRLAETEGLDLALIPGSGPHGRIVKRDIEVAKVAGTAKLGATAGPVSPPGAAPAAAAAPSPAAGPAPSGGMSDDQIRALYADGSYEELPHDGMRKTIARRLTESKQTIPHFYLTVDVELDALLKLRAELNGAAPTDGDGKPAYKLSVNDFVIKAMALALKEVPMANATFTSTSRLVHQDVDVGVAVAIPDGLITPVVRKADSKTLSVISNEMKDLARRARDKKLQPSEYQGGSTAVSNLGMFGIREFAAVINPPHGSILAVGEGSQRAVVKNGALAVGTVMTVTLSVDHRVVDGALGAQVLKAFKGLVEAPMRLLI
ncbi:MAG: pyruvate dehydrogenase complex dihydrolipoamide acetyltransferase [Pseudomonadota bacterium]